jgi:asparagine synthase (glutamine-hydrolysing)
MIWQPKNDWQRQGDLYWRGFAFIGGKVLDFSSVHVDVFANEGTARLWLRRLNGCFAIVYAPGGRVQCAAVDSGRTIPLFYDTRTTRLLDRVEPAAVRVRDLAWLGRQWWEQLEFLPGPHTLDPKIFSLTPGQLLWYTAGAIQVVPYTDPPVQHPAATSYSAAGERFIDTLLEGLERTAALAAGRPLVVMLSGGFDSRAVLVGLHRLGYRNLHALTYGRPETEEYRRASAVTGRLGVPHHFVDYGRGDLADYAKASLAEFTAYASFAQSVPQEQEWPAAYAASRIDAIRDGIFLLGLGGDTLGGAPVPLHYLRIPGRLSQRGVRDWLLHRYTQLPLKRGRMLLDPYLPAGPFTDEMEAVDAIRSWLIEERLAKYMFNGVRAYEFSGLDWYLPLWDQALRTFWYGLPLDMLRRREAYRDWLAEQLFRPAGVLLPDEPVAPPPVWRAEWIPPAWKRRPLPRRDPNGLHDLLLPALAAELGARAERRTINEWMGHYTTALYRRAE